MKIVVYVMSKMQQRRFDCVDQVVQHGLFLLNKRRCCTYIYIYIYIYIYLKASPLPPAPFGRLVADIFVDCSFDFAG